MEVLVEQRFGLLKQGLGLAVELAGGRLDVFTALAFEFGELLLDLLVGEWLVFDLFLSLLVGEDVIEAIFDDHLIGGAIDGVLLRGVVDAKAFIIAFVGPVGIDYVLFAGILDLFLAWEGKNLALQRLQVVGAGGPGLGGLGSLLGIGKRGICRDLG